MTSFYIQIILCSALHSMWTDILLLEDTVDIIAFLVTGINRFQNPTLFSVLCKEARQLAEAKADLCCLVCRSSSLEGAKEFCHVSLCVTISLSHIWHVMGRQTSPCLTKRHPTCISSTHCVWKTMLFCLSRYLNGHFVNEYYAFFLQTYIISLRYHPFLFSFSLFTLSHTHLNTNKQAKSHRHTDTRNILMDSFCPILSSRQQLRTMRFPSHSVYVLVLSVLRHSSLTMNIMCLESCSCSAHWVKPTVGPRGGKSQTPLPERKSFLLVLLLVALVNCRREC